LVVKKSLFNDVGIFDEIMPVCEDYDFFLGVGEYKNRLIINDMVKANTSIELR